MRRRVRGGALCPRLAALADIGAEEGGSGKWRLVEIKIFERSGTSRTIPDHNERYTKSTSLIMVANIFIAIASDTYQMAKVFWLPGKSMKGHRYHKRTARSTDCQSRVWIQAAVLLARCDQLCQTRVVNIPGACCQRIRLDKRPAALNTNPAIDQRLIISIDTTTIAGLSGCFGPLVGKFCQIEGRLGISRKEEMPLQ